MENSPCTKECPLRNQHCHSICKKYKDYRKAKDEENEIIRKKKEQEYISRLPYRRNK